MTSGKKLLLKWLVFLIVLFLVALAGVNLFVAMYGQRFIVQPEALGDFDADCVLVLGARVYETGALSPVLADRMTRGIEVYRLGAGKVLLLSGDHGSYGYDEVGSMHAYALEKGVADEDIFLDHAGFSTYESMYRAKEVFGVKKLVVVTQSYHLRRALYDARMLGMEAYGVASDLRPYRDIVRFEVREIAARAKDFAFVLFGVPPTYLGESIDLGGPASATRG